MSLKDSPTAARLTIATEGDLDDLRRLFQEYYQELGVDLCFQGFAAELQNLPGDYAPPKGALLIARVNGQAAGCVALRPFAAGVCEMKRMFVRPPFRRLGLGRQLAEEILAEALRLGCRRMVLDTLAHMRPALALYASLGFVPCAPYYHNPLPGAVYLAKELAC